MVTCPMLGRTENVSDKTIEDAARLFTFATWLERAEHLTLIGIMMPPAILQGLKHYRDHRLAPGGFLRAVLQNDLEGAVGRGDVNSLAALQEIVMWMRWDLPASAWGSPAKVRAWLAGAEENPG
jgi:hypothetical protein